MPTIEVTGKSLEDATRLAAEKLGASAGELTITVLEEAKGKGLFGQSKVRVRAELPDAAPAPAPVVTAPIEEKAVVSEPTPAPVAEVAAEAPAEEAAPEKKERAPRSGSRRGGKPKEAAAATAEGSTEEEQASVAPEVVATDEHAELLNGILSRILDAGDLAAQSTISGVNGRYVTLELNGKDVSYLVGKHGEVLNALQYLMNIISGRTLNNGVRTVLDGGNFRQKREESLTKMAQNIAREVIARGEEAVLNALPAFERRIVHKALAEIKGVTTFSEGEEPNRRVVIVPED